MTNIKVPQSEIEIYTKGLIFTTEKRTCTAIGKTLEKSHDSVSRILSSDSIVQEIQKDLLDAAIKLSKLKKIKIVIDDTAIVKNYALKTEGVSDIYNGATGAIERGFSVVVAVVTDGNEAIPISFDLWVSRGIAKNSYLSKQDQAIFILDELKKKGLKFELVLMDGLYCTKTMILWLKENNINFEMRMHSNRVVFVDKIAAQLKVHKLFKFLRNNRIITRRVIWNEIELYVTSYRIKIANHEYKTLFLVSNRKCLPREHTDAYEQRWIIEKMFRTVKQKLGFSDCQSTSLRLQKNHIHFVFYAYYKLKFVQKKYNFLSVDAAARHCSSANLRQSDIKLLSLDQIFGCVA